MQANPRKFDLPTSLLLPEDRPLKLSTLSPSQRQALINLQRKQAGEEVDFINIADAQALTDRGLAVRTQQGWIITSLGVELLTGEDDTSSSPAGASNVMPLTPKKS